MKRLLVPGPSGVQESNTALDLDVSNRGAGGGVLRVPEVRHAWPFLAAVGNFRLPQRHFDRRNGK